MRYSLVGLMIALATPATAQLSDPLAMTTDPADQAVMAEVAVAISSRKPDLAKLDILLAKLPRPTPLRGMVQTFRAMALSNLSDANPGPATAAIEEALRLLPDDPRPKLAGSMIFTFSGAPQRAADLWMQASRQAPELARMSDRYYMTALIARLREFGDSARADRVAARLGEIGFSAALAPERSDSALANTRQAVRDRRDSEALSAVTAIGDPDDLLTLYVDRRYEMVWPRIAEWAAPDLSDQSRRYLEELRSDWTAADDFHTAAPYAQRLAKMRSYAAVAQLFPPMFDRLRPGAYQEDAERLAPIVARSLAVLGRDAEARSLLDKVAAAMPADYGANALNIDGAYVTLGTIRTDWPEVIARADLFLARARSFGDSVNGSALLQVQAWRACALWRTGREAEAQQAIAQVAMGSALLPSTVMSMHLCRGDSSSARTLLIARLADENTRGWALAFVQPTGAYADTPLERLLNPVADGVRTSPEVVSAANAVGRILPKPVDETVPEGFDPFRAKPVARPSGLDAI